MENKKNPVVLGVLLVLKLSDLTLKERLIARRNGIKDETLKSRLRMGWDKKRAINEPINKRLTKEHLEIAKKNGINPGTVQNRVYSLQWDVKDAITKPVRQRKYEKCIKIAQANGIAKQTFYARVKRNGWKEEDAATIPVGKRVRTNDR